MANLIPFPTARGASAPAELFVRVGEAHYGQVASLYPEGKLSIRRAVFDASKLKHQRVSPAHLSERVRIGGRS